MTVVKFSISLPSSLASFVEMYRNERGRKSHAQVFEEALKLLRTRYLESAYRSSISVTDKELDNVVSDGLADETWWRP